ncbi:U4/U6.U5 small nuclear ribonucleoprotein 27 kDa protein isoform X1 [Haemorhous mexicanus]|uniref:U4/U6.U5 small nuclear ribonucleoprotein 27 kDa protein isoform X1 n=1 Tax=Haemorhous mexicanus TaxID=30427 RepID=UPI0028BD9005|nr:U4/U6.U5 small nuclear ribonucleoprotein 27 kDa protein isoform X1 [Haemorhous mexicanus]XP_059726503.1 U4/U6.U5 small nuclear ribonucleoprotein 27 kDa protein isoform X1 [Haemorhous mexicanus]
MGRSRSRSPPRRERRRSRSTSRDRDRRRRERSRSRDRDRRRSRSRSPHRRRSRSPRRHRSSSSSPARPKERRDEEKKELKDSKKERQITEEDLQGKTEEEIEMMKMMGFASFDTTKAIHEQKRRIQQAPGFHRLTLAQAPTTEGFLFPALSWVAPVLDSSGIWVTPNKSHTQSHHEFCFPDICLFGFFTTKVSFWLGFCCVLPGFGLFPC